MAAASQNALELIMSNEDFIEEWRKILSLLVQNQLPDADPAATNSINLAKLLYMRRRFVLEQLFGILLREGKKQESYQQLDDFFRCIFSLPNDFHLTESLIQSLQADLDRRIGRLQQISCCYRDAAMPNSSGQLFADVVLGRKREVANRISKIYIEFFVFCCGQLASLVGRVKSLLGALRNVYYGEQLMTAFRWNMTERLNFYVGLSENLNLRANHLLSVILQSLYSPENTQTLAALR